MSSLAPETTYYYQAVIELGGKEYRGEVKSFTTLQEEPVQKTPGWLEMPAASSGSDFFTESLGSGPSRNYSYLYDKTRYASLWEAYPLTKSHLSGDGGGSWSYNPHIDQDLQINVKSSSYGSNYSASDYSRGHLVPAADRKESGKSQQVYYLTNQVPQLQNKFNDGIWNSLEGAVRALTNSTDTVYVVTGVCFRKAGGSETIKTLTASSSSIKPASVPVANYFYKVILKVKRSGTTITSASTIGFWLEHKTYDSDSYSKYAVSVDQIEAWTGFDFFANLPDNIESAAETNTSWSSFQNF